jgi:hypothetical protein
VLFGRKVFLLSKTDHAEPGFRHITPHVLLRRIFGALGPSAALCGVGAVLVRLIDNPGHQAQPARSGNDSTVFRLSFLTIIINPGSLCSPPVFNDAKAVIEDGGIVRQRHAAEIAVLAIESPDIEKISRHFVLPTFLHVGPPRCGCKSRPPRQSFTNVIGAAPPRKKQLRNPYVLANAISASL